MAIGLDTSVVLRLLVGLPEAQARLARRRLERALQDGEVVLVTDLVVAEAYFALQYHYGVPKEAARELLHRLVESGVVAIVPPEGALALRPARGAGLVDRLIHERHKHHGAVTVTFERKQAALEGAQRLG
jgi:predicted nucleic acid-binding protein